MKKLFLLFALLGCLQTGFAQTNPLEGIKLNREEAKIFETQIITFIQSYPDSSTVEIYQKLADLKTFIKEIPGVTSGVMLKDTVKEFDDMPIKLINFVEQRVFDSDIKKFSFSLRNKSDSIKRLKEQLEKEEDFFSAILSFRRKFCNHYGLNCPNQ